MDSSGLNVFQKQVSELLLRHKSILDVLSKFNESNSSVHRSVIKSITECGCLEVNANKQSWCEEKGMEDAQEGLHSHLKGTLCENCLDAVSTTLGKNLFYMASLCNLLEIDLNGVIDEETNKCNTLGLFKLS
ncbi:DUF1573 domain-containing protein [Longirhabdus pacifica]|uniref:DUF1573 domain-containing protein n=1 Tax=Longirhabdus pacifica TaxID=2305227 RepID=UPI0010087AC8|nr:DUF1573 domain-containing protein [Longirhabdus pacifica]